MIKSQGLTFEYPAYEEGEAPVPVLRGIDLTIAPGEFVSIVGHNGSGKSTLARHFNALLTPTGGTLWVNGFDTGDAKSLWDIRQSVGMLFQNPDNQIVASVVEEDVAFGPENLGVPPEEIRQRVAAALDAVGMGAFAQASPHYLSGGQKQRIGIAGVLAMEPSCIVLDEPTAMLDPAGRKSVLEAVTRLNHEKGMTVVLITHFMEEAACASRVVVMDKGRVVMDDAPRAVFGRVEEVRALGLAVPQVTALAYELAQQGVPVQGAILTVDEFLQDSVIREVFV